MYIRNLILILFSAILISGCATTYAPSDWLPDTDEIQKEAYGGWMTLIVQPDSLIEQDAYLQYDGEFISSDENNVYLLADSLYIIPKENISSGVLEIDEKNSVEYGLWTFGGFIATISSGFYLIFTAPFWLITGIPATIGESNRDRYEYDKENTDSLYWEDIQKFARFPQGLPDNVELKNLEPKSNLKN